MWSKYHSERSTFYDVDIRETVYFCSENHKNEYLNKKIDPNYKTSQNNFIDREIDSMSSEANLEDEYKYWKLVLTQ